MYLMMTNMRLKLTWIIKVQSLSIRTDIFVSYGVIQGYFNLIKSNAMPLSFWLPIDMIGLSYELLWLKCLAQMVAKLWAVQKSRDILGPRLFFCDLILHEH